MKPGGRNENETMSTELERKAATFRGRLRRSKRIVIKLGTSVITHGSGGLAMGRLHGIIEDIAEIRRRGCQVILVSSGALGLGAGRLGATPRLLREKQACTAVGQVLLMTVYEQAFQRLETAVAQLLLTEDDFTHRTRYLNLRNTFNALLEMGVLPVVNENDPVSTAELELTSARCRVFGDNDKLSALVMSKMDAEALLVLSDVEGVYAPPGPKKGGKLIQAVDGADTAAWTEAVCEPGALGRGGMQTKLEAMRICTDSGGTALIANGKTPGILLGIFEGENAGTIFLPRRRLSGRKRWIAFASETAGSVTVTAGAREALEKRGASLLFAGVEEIRGEFARGDVLSIVDEAGEEFARGMSNHESRSARRLIGKHTRAVASLTHEPNFDAFVTRDNLVLVKG
jgi:glutamate 5-kinase